MEKRNWLNTPVTAVLVNLILFTILVVGITGTYFMIKALQGDLDTVRDTVTITGEGRVTAEPDTGAVTVTIITEGDEAEDAQEENIEQFNLVVMALKDLGVEEKDLQTTSFNVNPRYRYDEGERTQIGFEVRQSLEVTIRDLDKSGEIIQAAGVNGVNQVSGLSFKVDEPEQYREEARRKALENAKEKADELAQVTGVRLGKIISFSESAGGGVPPVPFFRGGYAEESMAMDVTVEPQMAAPQLEAGSEEIYVTATIVYEVK